MCRRLAGHCAAADTRSVAVSSAGMPAAVAMAAASILVTIPPVPTRAAGPPDRDAGEVGSPAHQRDPAGAGAAGRAVVERVHVRQQHQRVGLRRDAATSAASRSLSPKRISWVATVSFSLTTGRMPQLEQPLEGAPGVEVVGSAGDVVER